MSDSPNLSLPFIQPAQAQKHVTHNEALQRLDALVQLSVEDLYAAAPPDGPLDGQVYGIGAQATGAFAGRDGLLASFVDGAWLYLTPREGMRAWNKTSGALHVRQGALWTRLQTADLQNLDGIGINAAADAVNRLSVSSAATLLNHEGAGHRLKINKAAAGNTASLLYQTGFSGRAEMGLAGGDDFTVKVSADGGAWTTAMQMEAATGTTTFGAVRAASLGGQAVQQTPVDVTPGRLMRADYGYGRGNAVGVVDVSAGLPTGALIERGSNADGEYTRWADGTQICWRTLSFDTNFTGDRQNASMPAAFALAYPVVGSLCLHRDDLTGSGFSSRIRALRDTIIACSNTVWTTRYTASLGFGPITFLASATGRWF